MRRFNIATKSCTKDFFLLAQYITTLLICRSENNKTKLHISFPNNFIKTKKKEQTNNKRYTHKKSNKKKVKRHFHKTTTQIFPKHKHKWNKHDKGRNTFCNTHHKFSMWPDTATVHVFTIILYLKTLSNYKFTNNKILLFKYINK